MPLQHARGNIVAGADRDPDDDAHGLPFVKISDALLRQRRRAARGNQRQNQQRAFHPCISPSAAIDREGA
jgi:hypothetical protein